MPAGMRRALESALLFLPAVVSIAVLFVTVLFGAFSQVGTQNCAVCSGQICNGNETEICPGSILGLAIVMAGLIVLSLMAAWTLSVWTTDRPSSRLDAPNPSPLQLHPLFSIGAPFFVFLGWAALALGLMLPDDLFGYCHEGPCEYPYVISGFPLLLAAAGIGCLGAGIILFALQSRNASPH